MVRRTNEASQPLYVVVFRHYIDDIGIFEDEAQKIHFIDESQRHRNAEFGASGFI